MCDRVEYSLKDRTCFFDGFKRKKMEIPTLTGRSLNRIELNVLLGSVSSRTSANYRNPKYRDGPD
jgi:hypothetical protein